MRDGERAGLALALGCVAFIVLRALSPEFQRGFDWISLVLAFFVAVGLLLPTMVRGRVRGNAVSTEPGAEGTEYAPFAWEDLRVRMDAFAWPMEEGGMYDCLVRLATDQGYAAVCGAYATILLLLDQGESGKAAVTGLEALGAKGRLPRAQVAVLTDLLDMLEEFTRVGASRVSLADARGILELALRAMARLEKIAS